VFIKVSAQVNRKKISQIHGFCNKIFTNALQMLYKARSLFQGNPNQEVYDLLNFTFVRPLNNDELKLA
jgi:hypothetical protein